MTPDPVRAAAEAVVDAWHVTPPLGEGPLGFRLFDLCKAVGYRAGCKCEHHAALAAEQEPKRVERLMAAIAAEGASRCCYLPGAGNPEAWPTAHCDCKYVSPVMPGSTEQTGCCEMRAAYSVLSAALSSEAQDDQP
jgi:hypothetical protein